MGDPKRPKKKYITPNHPWKKDRIEQERIFIKEYGLKNKRELWRMEFIVKSFADLAKKLITDDSEQANKLKEQMFNKLRKLGLLNTNQNTIDDVLGLTVKDILERRLQTLVFKQNLALSVKQARQMIVHKHIAVNGKIVTSPSYIVKINDNIGYAKNSPFNQLQNKEVEKIKKLNELNKEKEVLNEAQ